MRVGDGALPDLGKSVYSDFQKMARIPVALEITMTESRQEGIAFWILLVFLLTLPWLAL